MKKLTSAFLGAFLAVFIFVQDAGAKTVVILRGIFGEILAPMLDYEAELRKRKYKVVMGSWLLPPQVKADYVITHSAGGSAGLTRYPGAKVFTIDPTVLNPGCSKKNNCTNYYAAINKVPFLICCGGYRVNGAKNIEVGGTPSLIVVAPGHVSMPGRVRDRILGQIR